MTKNFKRFLVLTLMGVVFFTGFNVKASRGPSNFGITLSSSWVLEGIVSNYDEEKRIIQYNKGGKYYTCARYQSWYAIYSYYSSQDNAKTYLCFMATDLAVDKSNDSNWRHSRTQFVDMKMNIKSTIITEFSYGPQRLISGWSYTFSDVLPNKAAIKSTQNYTDVELDVVRQSGVTSHLVSTLYRFVKYDSGSKDKDPVYIGPSQHMLYSKFTVKNYSSFTETIEILMDWNVGIFVDDFGSENYSPSVSNRLYATL